MYLAHFGLSQPPFKITAHSEFFFPGANRGPILDALIYAIRQGEGIIKVSGEVGSGKTMLCRMLQERLPADIETVYIANPSVSPEEILHAIAFEMQLSLPRDASRLEVMQALQDYLLERHSQGKQVVVFVEEAQSMPLATLEEIRLLSNLETQQYKLLQIVLFGQPELDQNLSAPGIRQLKERITHSFALKPLTVSEIGDYLMFRLRAADYHGPDLFSPAVVRLIARASKGLTRRVNIIADKALLAAFAENTHTLSASHVRAAAADSDFDLARVPFNASRMVAGVALLMVGMGGGVLLHAFLQKPSVEQRAAAPASSSGKAQPVGTLPPSPERMPPAAPTLVQQTVAGDIVAQRLEATEAWLASEKKSTSSIQLMVSNDPKHLRQHLTKISRAIDMGQVFVYRTKVRGQPAWTVLYGSFPSGAEAMAALGKLPESLRIYRPYLRTVQGVEAEIRQNRPE